MTNDQTENLEASHWFNQLIELNEPTELFNKLALKLQNKAQNKAASCLLANVYLFAQDPETHYITISLRPATYTKDRYHSDTVGYRPFVTKVLPQFEKLKLIKLAKVGMTNRDELGIGFRRRSRYMPTKKLLKVLASHNVNIDDIDIGSPEIIRLRGKKAKKDYRAKEKQQPKGQLIEYADTEHTRQLRGWPTQYNSFVQSFSIGLPDSLEPANRSATSFYRVFNVDFKKGGRLVGH